MMIARARGLMSLLTFLMGMSSVLLADGSQTGSGGTHAENTYYVVRVLSLEDGSSLSIFVQDDDMHVFSVGERSYGLQATRPEGEEQRYAMNLFRVKDGDGGTTPLTTMYSVPHGNTTFVRLGFTITMMPVQANDDGEVEEFIQRVMGLESLDNPGVSLR